MEVSAVSQDETNRKSLPTKACVMWSRLLAFVETPHYDTLGFPFRFVSILDFDF